jgi:glycosyltransferase involved in cell wall biosynthesis
MKVLFITSWYPDKKYPGSGIFIKEHAKAVIDQGYDLIVLHINFHYSSSVFKFSTEFFLDDGYIPVHRINLESRYWKWFYHWMCFTSNLTFRYIKNNILKGFKPDIIHAHVIFPSGIVGSYVSNRLKIPLFISEHWSGFEKFCRHPMFRAKALLALQRSTGIMPVSGFLAGRIMPFLKDQSKIRVIPNIIDSSRYKLPPEKTLITPYHSLNFIMIASWHRRKVNYKRPDLIFEALKIFSMQFKGEVTLRVVGDGNLLDKYKIESSNYPFKCIFTGFLSKDEINGLLGETDFFLHASDFETFSVVTAEALMTGTPVIVSDLPALRELVNPGNGILVKNEVMYWVEAITYATMQNWDTGKISASVSEKFSYESVGKKITSAYDQVII